MRSRKSFVQRCRFTVAASLLFQLRTQADDRDLSFIVHRKIFLKVFESLNSELDDALPRTFKDDSAAVRAAAPVLCERDDQRQQREKLY